MGKLVPIVLVLVSFGGGVGAGKYLQPEPPVDDTTCVDGEDCPVSAHEDGPVVDEKGNLVDQNGSSYAALKKQFIIPILTEERVTGLVVASIAIAVDEGTVEPVFEVEPKLRDAVLQVFFIHASSGGFRGDFLNKRAMTDLRERLNEVVSPIVGKTFHEVLLTEVVRQDF